ncbi:hypothetical protein FB45DRAFT_859260 [Roridomyces roridus]|uniref:Uncharacterized protein n=1 Tax=Roridomyces roridus TaxID=1738132 RepID=A0AAD7CJF7_9AGAR|nr:hypothetical protein FB45DRAFT_859260 [Roridomyces roridus]
MHDFYKRSYGHTALHITVVGRPLALEPIHRGDSLTYPTSSLSDIDVAAAGRLLARPPHSLRELIVGSGVPARTELAQPFKATMDGVGLSRLASRDGCPGRLTLPAVFRSQRWELVDDCRRTLEALYYLRARPHYPAAPPPLVRALAKLRTRYPCGVRECEIEGGEWHGSCGPVTPDADGRETLSSPRIRKKKHLKRVLSRRRRVQFWQRKISTSRERVGHSRYPPQRRKKCHGEDFHDLCLGKISSGMCGRVVVGGGDELARQSTDDVKRSSVAEGKIAHRVPLLSSSDPLREMMRGKQAKSEPRAVFFKLGHDDDDGGREWKGGQDTVVVVVEQEVILIDPKQTRAQAILFEPNDRETIHPFADGSWREMPQAKVIQWGLGGWAQLLEDLQQIEGGWCHEPTADVLLLQQSLVRGPSQTDFSNQDDTKALWKTFLRFCALDFVFSRVCPRQEPLREERKKPSLSARPAKVLATLKKWDGHGKSFLAHADPEQDSSTLQVAVQGLRWVQEYRSKAIMLPPSHADNLNQASENELRCLSWCLLSPLLLLGHRRLQEYLSIFHTIQIRQFLGIFRPPDSALRYVEKATGDALVFACEGQVAGIQHALRAQLQKMPAVLPADRDVFDSKNVLWPWSISSYWGENDVQRTEPGTGHAHWPPFFMDVADPNTPISSGSDAAHVTMESNVHRHETDLLEKTVVFEPLTNADARRPDPGCSEASILVSEPALDGPPVYCICGNPPEVQNTEVEHRNHFFFRSVTMRLPVYRVFEYQQLQRWQWMDPSAHRTKWWRCDYCRPPPRITKKLRKGGKNNKGARRALKKI